MKVEIEAELLNRILEVASHFYIQQMGKGIRKPELHQDIVDTTHVLRDYQAKLDNVAVVDESDELPD